MKVFEDPSLITPLDLNTEVKPAEITNEATNDDIKTPQVEASSDLQPINEETPFNEGGIKDKPDLQEAQTRSGADQREL